MDKSIFKKTFEDETKVIYEAVVYSISLKVNIKVAYTEYLNEKGEVTNTILYFSTNTSRDSIDIVRYYKARFQMEFIFRDGKQFMGLDNCQARSEEKVHNHVNHAMTAVNIAKAIIRQGNLQKDSMRQTELS
ncbi:MAG: transposase [Saprospiraceae bacterium]|nr:transposase [Saprospiraceae bacterium]